MRACDPKKHKGEQTGHRRALRPGYVLTVVTWERGRAVCLLVKIDKVVVIKRRAEGPEMGKRARACLVSSSIGTEESYEWNPSKPVPLIFSGIRICEGGGWVTGRFYSEADFSSLLVQAALGAISTAVCLSQNIRCG